MTAIAPHREFKPGTTGWSVDDLDDPAIEALWNQGRYEIVEGVLTEMPPAMFDGGLALKRLVRIFDDYAVKAGLGDGFAFEVDLILGKLRLPVVDACFLTPEQQEAQKRAHAATGKRRQLKFGRILVPPTLIIESISVGHELHDRDVKRRWYAEAGVPNYWMMDAEARSLECLVLEGKDYRLDQSGHADAEVRPTAFPGLVIPLGRLWAV
jgi:Uma2 family endonuclease